MNLFQIKAEKNTTEMPKPTDFPAHIHDTYEIYCFLSGDGAYSVEGNTYPMSRGDIILLTHAETHHPVLKSGRPYERIYVNFNPTAEFSLELEKELLTPFQDRPIGFYNHYPSAQFPNNHWRHYLDSIYKAKTPDKKQIYLMVLLEELTECFPQIKEKSIVNSPSEVLEITHYIDEHLTDELTLEQICKHFFISKSQLTRRFQNSLGTSVGDYILTKRLVLAKTRIQQGERPTAVFRQCGFHDYSVFFKAFKKKFGFTPKETFRF